MHPWLLNGVGKPHLIGFWWRKARIAARIILKRRAGRPLSRRDHRRAGRLGADPGVTNRLVDQAVNSLTARNKYGPRLVGWFARPFDTRRRTVEATRLVAAG